jgi:V/A-type H+-transporting ATPase subunit A
MLELVEVGDEHLVGEVIGLDGDIITAQVYEETSGMRTGAPIFGTGLPLSVELGPGLLKSIFDGVQRPLPLIEMQSGSFIGRGMRLDPLYRKDRWRFTPRCKEGDSVIGGQIYGTVMETETFEHRVMVPPDFSGTLTWVAEEGEYTIEEPIARLKVGKEEKELTMLQRWPVRRYRPYKSRLASTTPLITGQRILDAFFPVAKAAQRVSRVRSARQDRDSSTASPSGRTRCDRTSAAANAAMR